MQVTEKDIEYVAQLSRLVLTSEEKELFVKNLNDVIEHADKLNELDTNDVEPTAHIQSIVNVYRSDEIYPSLPREDLLCNAPDHDDHYFRVPIIIE